MTYVLIDVCVPYGEAAASIFNTGKRFYIMILNVFFILLHLTALWCRKFEGFNDQAVPT
jgi:hypothetical protein